eukprot:TRINITY_DN1786_c0_g1_i2.p1 TRINITY_DN1786_c0_g1~~TRINITY_DN1786_c0_g1_i2.p1  ORF type:complete len:352 (+),score=90.61 TRINITY_DN1786_c0_g1_i2:299-1354(+)
MGFETKSTETQSLLHHGDEFKNKIRNRIINGSRRASYVIPIMGGIFTLGGLICLILSFTLFKAVPVTYKNYNANSNHTLTRIFGIVFTAMAPLWICMSWCWCMKLKTREALGSNIFEEGNYLYHFVYAEGERWKAFAEYKWNLKSKIMIFAYVISFVIFAFGALPFGLILSDNSRSRLSPGLAFAIGWCPFLGAGLFIFLLILSLTQYQRFRKFKPDVHCMVLSRGAVYTLGNMHSLQHCTAYPSSLMMNLVKVKMGRREIGPFTDQAMLELIGFTVNHKGHRIPIHLEAPVPEDAVQHLIRWLPELVQPFGSELVVDFDGLNQPFFAQQQKLEVQPIVGVINDQSTKEIS